MCSSNVIFGRRIKDLKHTRELVPLKMRDTVSIQNRHSNTPLKWDYTGTIMEVGNFNKYTIKIDGSGRLTKEAISRLASVARLPAADNTAPPPTQSQPRRPERVARRSQAATPGRRPSRQ